MNSVQRSSIELQELGLDLERQEEAVPGDRRLSTLSHIVQYITNINQAADGRTLSVSRILNVIWSGLTLNRSRQTTPTRAIESSGLGAAKNDFIEALTNQKADSSNFIVACKWYIAFLESKITEAWMPLFRPILARLCRDECKPCDVCLDVAFRLLTAVVLQFHRKDLALMEIVDSLYNKDFFVEGLGSIDSEEENENDRLKTRSQGLQLAFAAIGWISLLYTAKLKPEPLLLQIVDPTNTPNPSGRSSRLRKPPKSKAKIFTNYEQDLENTDQRLSTWFKAFGKIIPELNRDSCLLPDPANSSSGRREGWINTSLVCFHTLHKVASIKIEWVDCLSLHLEFDNRTKVLKLFRFPSPCFVMCSNDGESFMSEIFCQVELFGGVLLSPAEIDETPDFFREVLLSYRLIFGQTNRSFKDFNSELSKWNLKGMAYEDKMLYRLCGQSCESESAREIYDEIGAQETSSHYNPDTDFPFLGKKLKDLQDYVEGHNPHNFRALWYDRRNVSWWWTFWAVIIIGGMGLVFAALQVLLQIWALRLAEEQLKEGGRPGSSSS